LDVVAAKPKVEFNLTPIEKAPEEELPVESVRIIPKKNHLRRILISASLPFLLAGIIVPAALTSQPKLVEAKRGLYQPRLVMTAQPAPVPTVAVKAVESSLSELTYLKGQSLMEKQQWLAAKIAFENAIEMETAAKPEYWLAAAEASLKLNDLHTAQSYIDKSNGADTFEVAAVRGQIQLKLGASRDAIVSFNEALQIKSDAETFAGRAIAYADQQNYSASENDWRSALALEPTNGDWHFRLGQLLDRSGRHNEAVIELKRSIANGTQFSKRANELIER
jgi:tetratricopeptide (TPR) repeat protein